MPPFQLSSLEPISWSVEGQHLQLLHIGYDIILVEVDGNAHGKYQFVVKNESVSCSVMSHVRLLVTQWTVTRQASLPMEFSRQEY